MRLLLQFFATFILAICCINKAAALYKKVLIISTNVDSLQGNANGTFLMEIAFPMAEFEKEGIEVDILKAARRQYIIGEK